MVFETSKAGFGASKGGSEASDAGFEVSNMTFDGSGTGFEASGKVSDASRFKSGASVGMFGMSGMVFDASKRISPTSAGAVNVATKRTNMAKVKFSLSGVPDGDAVQTCNSLKTALTGNANFPNPPVPLAAFGTLIATAQTKLTASNTAWQVSMQATTDKDNAIGDMATAANQLAAYVDLMANGDESKILSAGLSVRASRQPQSVPDPVQNLSVTAGDNSGELDAQWDPPGNAKSYEVQTSADPFSDATWKTTETVTNSKAALMGLTSGAKIWVRVRGINSAGKGAWSDPAVKVVP